MRTFEITYVHLSNNKKLKAYVTSKSFAGAERKLLNHLKKTKIIIHDNSISINTITNLGEVI